EPGESFSGLAPAQSLEERVHVLGRFVFHVLANVSGADAASRTRPLQKLLELRGEELRLSVGGGQQTLDRVAVQRRFPILRSRAAADSVPTAASSRSPFFSISRRSSTPAGGAVAVTSATVPSLPRSRKTRRAAVRIAGLLFSSGNSARISARTGASSFFLTRRA